MASVVRTNQKEYFTKENTMASRNMSGRRFMKVYGALKTYDEEEAKRLGICDRGNREAYDSLWKVKTLWNTAIVQFQSMRNPPRCLSLDESMVKYTVCFVSNVIQQQ